MILIIDFGSQYTLLIERCLMKFGIQCQVVPPSTNKITAVIRNGRPRGIILSGGPESVFAQDAPMMPSALLRSGIPILGICYGQQLVAHLCGGTVLPQNSDIPAGYGRDTLTILTRNHPLFSGCAEKEQVWVSHGDSVTKLPEGFFAIGASAKNPHAAFSSKDGYIIGLQFHPEVDHTEHGRLMLENFLTRICRLTVSDTRNDMAALLVREVQECVGEEAHVILGASGGVDSTTLALLLRKALGPERIWLLFINNGLLRKGEPEEIKEQFGALGFQNFQYLDATDDFLRALAGVRDPEKKRRIIGLRFMHHFKQAARNLHERAVPIRYLAQGTIAPDRIESAHTSAHAHRIKTHHNLVVPKNLGLAILEPLAKLYKHEVRDLARGLGMPDDMLARHPFPGPGLAVRIIGNVTKERLAVLREADAIYQQELRRSGLYDMTWQAFAVLLAEVRSVGVMGDQRTYANPVALRAVTSRDAMTADWVKLPHEFLDHVARRIVNEVPGVNRVVYDITSKPPGTIEWE